MRKRPDGVEDAWETAPVVEASSPEEAAGLAITDRLPEIGLARFETDTFGEAIIFVKGVTGRVHSFRVEYLCLPHVEGGRHDHQLCEVDHAPVQS